MGRSGANGLSESLVLSLRACTLAVTSFDALFGSVFAGFTCLRYPTTLRRVGTGGAPLCRFGVLFTASSALLFLFLLPVLLARTAGVDPDRLLLLFGAPSNSSSGCATESFLFCLS